MTFPRKGGRGLKGRFGSDVPLRPSKPSPSLRQYPFTLPCLQCDYSNRGTWKKTIQSQGFLKTKDSRFFANGTIEFKVQLCNRWKLLDRLNLPHVSGKKHSNLWMLSVRLQKNLRIFCFKKSYDWTIFQVPRFEQSHCKTRQFLLWCEIHCINEITVSGTYSLLF